MMGTGARTIAMAMARIEGLRGLPWAEDFDAALLLNPPDVFSYTGTKQPANLLIPAEGSHEPRLFVRRARDFVEEDIREVGFPAKWVADGQSFREVAARLGEHRLHRGVLGTAGRSTTLAASRGGGWPAIPVVSARRACSAGASRLTAR